jgi:F-type H+-transporting ATPase subunit a
VKNVAQFNEAMAGKVLIWQPFGSPKSLYEAGTGFCISRYMVLELFAAAFLVFVCLRLAKRTREGDRARGTGWNMLEGILFFLRDYVARPAIGHDADRFVPLLWTMFLFILTMNLFGLVPWAGSPTAAWAVTFAMAAVTLLAGMVDGTVKFGPIGFWTHFVPHMELPWFAAPIIYPLLFIIEIAGMFIRHLVLSVRLLANMVAGHLVLLGIMGLIVIAAENSTKGQWFLVTVIAVTGSALFSILELFVAFLQAYIFAFLSALFIGAAIHKH